MHRNSDSSGWGFRGADYSSSSPSRDFRAANDISQMLVEKIRVFQNLGLNNIGVSEQKKKGGKTVHPERCPIQNHHVIRQTAPLQQSPLWSRRCQWLARSPENYPQNRGPVLGGRWSLCLQVQIDVYIYIYVGVGSPYECICKILKCSHDDQYIYELCVCMLLLLLRSAI